MKALPSMKIRKCAFTCIVPYQYMKLSLSWLDWKIHRTQHIVILITMIYYSNVVRILSRIKRVIHLQPSYAFSLSWATADTTLINEQQKCSSMCVMLCPGKPVRDSVPKFISGAAHVGTLLSMHQSSRQQQVFSIDHLVCTNSLGKVNHHYQLETVLYQCVQLSAKFPVAHQGLTL